MIERRVENLPFGEEFFQDLGSEWRKFVEAFVALVRLAPFAEEETLRFQTAEEWVEGALFDCHATVSQDFAEGVAVLLGTKAREDGEDERAAAKLQAEVFEESGGVLAV